MATLPKIEELKKVLDALAGIDRGALLRKNIGDESLSDVLQPILEELDEKAEFARRYASGIGDASLDAIKNCFAAIVNALTSQAARPNTEYIAQKGTLLIQVNAQREAMLAHWPNLVAAAVLDRGFLEDEGIRKEYEATVSEMKQEASESIASIKTESNKVLEEARNLANEIETRARRTAAKISVSEAQNQFKEAQKTLNWQVAIWACLSIAALIFFGALIHNFLQMPDFPKDWTWQIAYYSAIHITTLGAAGAFATFCMRIFRAQLHMFQYNLHRQRVTNSIEAFVESAVTPEQRDLILTKLVDAVVSFGNSGLLREDGSESVGSKLTIDNINRTLTGATKEPSK